MYDTRIVVNNQHSRIVKIASHRIAYEETQPFHKTQSLALIYQHGQALNGKEVLVIQGFR